MKGYNMSKEKNKHMTRRSFISGAGAAAFAFTIVKPGSVSGTRANSRIEAGCIGLGNRGKMIAGMLENHGGYQITAVADYFTDIIEAAGKQLKVSKARCFSGLSAAVNSRV